MEDRTRRFSGHVEISEMVVRTERSIPAANSTAVLWTAVVLLGVLFSLPLYVLMAWSLVPVGLLAFVFAAFILLPPLAIGGNSALLDIRRSPTGHLIERAWSPVLGLMCRAGFESYEFKTAVIERHTRVPVSLTLSDEGHTPRLGWQWARDRAWVVSEVELPIPAEPQERPERRDSGHLDLEEGRLALGLFRDPHMSDEVLLEARHTRSGERLTIRLKDPAWLSRSARASLPALERDGIELAPTEQEALISALVQIAQLQGAHIPTELAQVAEVCPVTA